jgi:hypothetical protein
MQNQNGTWPFINLITGFVSVRSLSTVGGSCCIGQRIGGLFGWLGSMSKRLSGSKNSWENYYKETLPNGWNESKNLY